METKIELQGIYKKTIIRDLRDGFTSFLLETKNTHERKHYHCTGNILSFEEGEKITVQGTWETNQIFGLQIKDVVVRRPPMDSSALLQFLLTSGSDIGVMTAKNVVEHFGEQLTQHDLDEGLEDKMVLLRGLTRKQCQSLLHKLRNRYTQQELYEYIVKHGGIYKDYLSMYKKYGYEALEMFKRSPYEIGRKSGLRFVICDSVAKENGGRNQSVQRLEYGVRRALQAATAEGHTYLNRQQLLRETQRLLRNAVFPEPVSLPAINLGIELATRSGVVREENRYYIQSIRNAEKRVAENIGRMSFQVVPYEKYCDDLVGQVMEKTGIHFAEGQQEAFSLLHTPGVKVLLGGPGTGKTTTVRGLVEAFLTMKPDAEILLCAPTGRAAQRLSEATGREAFTIHRLLEFTKGNITEKKLASKALRADLYVIDETSMINIELADFLLEEIEAGATIIFVGDNEQLPAIGAGNFLHDLTCSKGIPTVELTEVFRQKSTSVILKNARAICMGISKLSKGDDFELISAEDDKMLTRVQEEFLKYYDRNNPYSVQVLACTKSIVSQLNTLIQKLVNGNAKGVRYGGTVFRVGDKIIMNSNNYRMRYFNGDMGIITDIVSEEYIKVKINQVEILLTIDEFEDMELGYCITVHKSQGSEYPVVFLVLPSKPKKMLKRKILFTGITRGKQNVKLFATKATIAMAVANNEEDNRQSTLMRRLEIQRKKLERTAEKGAA